MADENLEDFASAETSTGAARMVPVTEAIKYRRRAQQAEGQLQQLEQQLEELRSQIQREKDELATVEAQRDEAQTQAATVENRLAAERLLNEAGVVDIETASVLLSKRLDLTDQLDREQLARSIEQLLLDKPFLRRNADAALPPKTASPRPSHNTPASQLAQVADRAARSGDRKDIAEYLRLRRQASLAGQG